MAATEARIVEVAYARGLALVACDLLQGEIAVGERFAATGKIGEWRVVATAPVDPVLREKGRRGVTLSPSRDGAALAAGDLLTQK
jgi:hypothetical protein